MVKNAIYRCVRPWYSAWIDTVKRPTEGEAALILLDRAYRSGSELTTLSMVINKSIKVEAALIEYEQEYRRQYLAARAAILELNRQAP